LINHETSPLKPLQPSTESTDLKIHRPTDLLSADGPDCNYEITEDDKVGNNISLVEVAVPRSAPANVEGHQVANHNSRKRKFKENSEKLQLPDSIHSMFQGQHKRWIDNPTDHNNRIRSFPHMEGNWATHIFIPVDKDERFIQFVTDVIQLFKPLEIETFPEFHVSLSRTVTIRHHWIEPLVDSLRENLKALKSCICDLTEIKLYTNDEKTRTFVCIELSQDEHDLLEYVKAVDKCFAEFKLPPYYSNPSFHISIGWCLGDVVDQVTEAQLLKAKEMLGEFMAANPELSIVLAQQIWCQAGNKSFVISLSDANR
ncbi:U6 snRNA phosphodiesterase 1-like, partial [Physella acuta]|uniref:U6 snRNA phosphodiesterase 1-like n=1 Tax=Physella acuta TaxID=109671 RepID=UPI0027DD036B